MTSPSPTSDLASGFPEVDLEQWRGLVEKALKGADFDKLLVSKTADAIRIAPLYTRANAVPGQDTAVPGSAPLTRGTSAVRAGLGWDIRAQHTSTDAAAVNAAILEDLGGGVTSIELKIGGRGLSADAKTLATALHDVLLDVCPVVLKADADFFNAATALISVYEQRGITPADRQGSFSADPLGTLAQSGRLSEPVQSSLARAVALCKVTEASPKLTTFTADGSVYHNAGASEAEELAAMLATFVEYLRAAEAGGLAIDTAIRQISVSLASDADQFATIAKLRAARRLLWRVADACGAGDAAASIRLSTSTSYRMMAKRDPWTNILRTTIACAASAMGGADAIVVLPFTVALGQPDGFARRVARNIQIVCQEESHLGRVNDPAGGSWFLEHFTDELARSAWSIFQQIETEGGMAAALQSGMVQDMIQDTAETRRKAIATGKQALTGVSAFPLLGDDGVHAEPWPAVAAAVPTGDRPAITVTALPLLRLGQEFEDLRDAADAAGGYTIFLASMGKIVDHNVRTTWTKNYLAAGGITTLISDGYSTATAAADAFKASGATTACICSSDAMYAELAAETAAALKAAGASRVLMAGKPGDAEADYRAAGVDGFIFAGADAVATLKELHRACAA